MTRSVPSCKLCPFIVRFLRARTLKLRDIWFVQINKALQHIVRLRADIRGQGIVEFALMLALVAFGAVAAEQVFACEVNCGYEMVANQLQHILAKGKRIPPGQAKKCSKKCT